MNIGDIRRVKKLAISIITSVAISGCVVFSEHPLTPLGKHTPDPRLDGIWIGVEGKPVFQILSRDDGWITLTLTERLSQSDGLEVIYQKAIPSLINGKRFLSVKNLILSNFGGTELPDPDSKNFMIVKYRISPDGEKLELNQPITSVISEAIKNGTIMGRKTEKNEWVIQDPSQKVAAYFDNLPETAFKNVDTFVRLRKF